MDRRERVEDQYTANLSMLTGWQAKMWTALPGKLFNYSPTKNTVSVRLAILLKQRHADGSYSSVPIPDLLDCPVCFPGGGGFSLTFPLLDNDECLVVFASRCIDEWWQSGADRNEQFEFRMHDLSDGFCIPGVRSVPNVPGSISTANVQLRSDDGLAFIEVAPSHNVKVKTPATVTVVAETKVILQTPIVECTGQLKVSGLMTYTGGLSGSGGSSIAGGLGVDGISFGSHKHTGVQSGTGTTGGPTA